MNRNLPLKSDPFYRQIFFLMILGLIFLVLAITGMQFWKCPINYVFHINCPGCGITRGVWCLFHGDFVGAINYNPLAIFAIFLPVALVLMVVDIIMNKRYLKRVYSGINGFLYRYRNYVIPLAVIYVVFILIYRNI